MPTARPNLPNTPRDPEVPGKLGPGSANMRPFSRKVMGADYSLTEGDMSVETAHSSVIIPDPEILSGMPAFAGTRVPAKNLIDYLEHGRAVDDFAEDFPTVRRDR